MPVETKNRRCPACKRLQSETEGMSFASGDARCPCNFCHDSRAGRGGRPGAGTRINDAAPHGHAFAGRRTPREKPQTD